MKLASSCFNACEVGCDPQTVEGALISADSSIDHHWVDFWVDLLGHSMTDMAATEQLLKIPAIRFRYANWHQGPRLRLVTMERPAPRRRTWVTL